MIDYKKTPEERRQALLGYKIKEMVGYRAELDGHTKMSQECKADFEKLDG